jgi:hypothetical protein
LPLRLVLSAVMALAMSTPSFGDEIAKVDFNRDVRSILSNTCFKCHGPDDAERQGGLRLDEREGLFGEGESGAVVVVPGDIEASELTRRITSDDADEAMPPADSGITLSEHDVKMIVAWVEQGANYSRHWSYERPVRPDAPPVDDASWPRSDIDRFVLARLQREGLVPNPEADRYAMVRRLSLDLTGLPPTLDEVEAFIADSDPDAYERLVDHLLAKPAYGEHWARLWLDLARYADSAGYADDPLRTIWAYRDWVIRSLNANMPFDQFTIEQIAGDLLPDASEDQVIATAFHRNTMTNSEGGTDDEEFRNVAIVDRVNTTMAVWMGTTITCAQCHNHKYDPITQKDFFRLFAILNNTADADVKDESPLREIWTDEQQANKQSWTDEIARLEQTLATATPELLAAQEGWESRLGEELPWQVLVPSSAVADSSRELIVSDDGEVRAPPGEPAVVYTLQFDVPEPSTLSAFRLEVLADKTSADEPGPSDELSAEDNLVVTGVRATITPPESARKMGRFVRITILGDENILSLAEVQVFSGDENIAGRGRASQSSTASDGPAELAIDGTTDGHYFDAKSTTHTQLSTDPWWEADLQSALGIDRVVVWNRTDGNGERLSEFQISILDGDRAVVWEQAVATAPAPSSAFAVGGPRNVVFTMTAAVPVQPGFNVSGVLSPAESDDDDGPKPDDIQPGWAIAPEYGESQSLVLLTADALELEPGARLTFAIEHKSTQGHQALHRIRLSVTDDVRAGELTATPGSILAILRTGAEQRSGEQQVELTTYFLGVTPELQAQRDRLAAVKKQLAEIKPYTTVPIMRELPEDKRRTTRIQRRGNFLDLGEAVTPGLPAAFPAPDPDEPPNRLTLARWLVDQSNPLTARVVVNRYWETIFGRGLVQTSEEFGSQGDLPTHSELLDWLATELVRLNWDTKALLRLIVTSATYRQSAAVTAEAYERDSDNTLLARGPRFRLSAEVIRDQALHIGGLLSEKMYGPPVMPPQPQLGVSAAFGSSIDWTTSAGEDRHRRGLYTNWRRSNPYPSMAAFDAPNREVCTVRRTRTNTPLQALVTLNDTVYIEAAQGLSRRAIQHEGDAADRAVFAFRLCLARPPSQEERDALISLYEQAAQEYTADHDAAVEMATVPLGPAPDDVDVVDLAAWTVVSNVLLNMDELFLKR